MAPLIRERRSVRRYRQTLALSLEDQARPMIVSRDETSAEAAIREWRFPADDRAEKGREDNAWSEEREAPICGCTAGGCRCGWRTA